MSLYKKNSASPKICTKNNPLVKLQPFLFFPLSAPLQVSHFLPAATVKVEHVISRQDDVIRRNES